MPAVSIARCPDYAGVDETLAVVDRGTGIRSYCCREICPNAAIDLRVSRVGRTISRLAGR